MTVTLRLISTYFGVLITATATMPVAGCNDNLPTSVEQLMDEDSPATSSDFIDRQLPNPVSEVILNWAPLPDGREWGSTAGIDVGPDGHIWAYDRCGGMTLAGGCEENPDRDPIFKFNKDTGEVMTSFGAGLFVLPHGLHVDAEGSVWVTDSLGNESGTKGHQVIKFSPDGEILMRLGIAGQPGIAPGQLNEPCDVITER